jgi:hypothetical protein
MQFDWQSIDWQSTIVLTLVIAAGAHLARFAWKSVMRRESTSCGGCANCPASSAQSEPIVSLTDLASTANAAAKR